MEGNITIEEKATEIANEVARTSHRKSVRILFNKFNRLTMSDFEYNTGYFYPLNEYEYKQLNDVDFFGNDIVQSPFYFETFRHNHYLVLGQTHSYGIENHEFGHSRPLTGNEKNLVPPKFEQEFTKINFDKTKFKFVEYCWYNSVDCKDYYLESKPRQSETMTIEQAIKYCDDEIWDFDKESINQHHEIGKWLSELQSYKDKTYITDEWLRKNNFEFKIGDKDDPDYYLYCDDVEEITAILSNEEAGIWEICIQFLDHGDTESLDICTVGQLRMFLAIEGLDEIVKQLK